MAPHLDPDPAPYGDGPDPEPVEFFGSTPLRVLLVEDEPDHAALVAAYLEEAADLHVDLVHVPTVERATAVLASTPPAYPFNVVLCDQRLSDSEYWETVERVVAAAGDVPVVALTSIGDTDVALGAVRQGAQDYLVKSELSPEILRRTIRYAVGRAQRTGELRAVNDALRFAQAEAARWAKELQELNTSLERRVAEQTARVRALSAQLATAEVAERQRIAHVLHDDLQQRLHALSITLSLLARAPSDEERERLSDRAERALTEATALTRSLASDLSQTAIDTDQLGDVFRWLADQQQESFGLDVDVAGEAVVRDPTLRALLFHLVRELLFNVAKHAGTGEARVVVEEADGVVTVAVADQGQGFVTASDASTAGGFGLTSVRDRVEAVGGTFAVESAPGMGTRVTLAVALPLDAGDDGA